MLDKKTAEPGPAKPKGGKPKAAKATRATASVLKAAAPRSSKENVQERIQRRAYELWEIEGRPEGRQHAHWHQAELEITRAHSHRASAH